MKLVNDHRTLFPRDMEPLSLTHQSNMADNDQVSAAVVNLRPRFLLFLFIIVICRAVSGHMSKKLYPPMKDDIPFIKCDVCQKAVKYLFRKTKSMREETSSTKVIVYFQYILNFGGGGGMKAEYINNL